MLQPKLSIEQLSQTTDIPFDLLELADPSRVQIDKYLKTGTCYVAKIASKTVGVVVLNEIDSFHIEVKNIAVRTKEQGKGIGKALLRHSESRGRDLGYSKLIIGTGNSSIRQLALYQKEGFEMDRIEKDFFLKNYSTPIFENGIQCKHLVILKKDLSK
ncbi:GNAT family N-acetyltransferase [Fulvivirga lutea]|uniref:GNAT family N-acetyltransferase n=1 Tax=Fulvivirga lutea TaxID=2810512 RepID=A0A974WHV4_9BACT|nr:GNAT family N-acetyltransferase [Fulvivirga lutea]QSE98849.1 GNAT family N-acetyltransferase [Fulvivirga lutea]